MTLIRRLAKLEADHGHLHSPKVHVIFARYVFGTDSADVAWPVPASVEPGERVIRVGLVRPVAR